MTGKERCEFLRNIRKSIAEMNGLNYEPHECTHEGWCPGYCPVCDTESADLMRQLERKESLGTPMHIDTESIKALDDMVKEKFVHLNDDNDDVDGMEVSQLGDIPDPDLFRLEGDVIAPEETTGIMPPPPHRYEDETNTTQGLPEPPRPTEDSE